MCKATKACATCCCSAIGIQHAHAQCPDGALSFSVAATGRLLHTAGDQALLAEEPFTLLQASGVRCEATGTQSTQGGDNAP